MSAPTQAIERLQKKLEKEPNSLVFLQLVEEYRKEGLHENALAVCKEGVRKHPNYWSARVSLGRMYYERGDIAGAQEELERVIHSVPDNLLANKILGEIYLRLNRTADALKRFRIVQMLTPADREVNSHIERLEARIPREEPVEEAAPTLLIPSLRESMVFPELDPGPIADIDNSRDEAPEAPTEKEMPPYVEPEAAATGNDAEKTVIENLAHLVPGLDSIATENSEQSGGDIRIEPPELSHAETYSIEEQLADRSETVEPETSDALSAENTVEEDYAFADADPGIVIEPVVADEQPVEIAQPVASGETEDELITEESTAPTQLMEIPQLDIDSPKDSGGSNSDELARIASIFLEDQPSVIEPPVLETPVTAEMELQGTSGADDFSTVESELSELEQVIEEPAPRTGRRDSTQPILVEEDDTAPEAEELTSESLAEMYLQQGQIDRAIKVYQNLLLNDPANEQIQEKLRTLNPVDALIASASHIEPDTAPSSKHAARQVVAQPFGREAENLSEERRRKINTLENWLAAIRREH